MFELSHVERVIRHLVRFGSSRTDAEDLAQEALVIAWRKRDTHDRDHSLDAWLYGIARNVYRNHARGRRRRGDVDHALDYDLVGEPGEAAGALAVQAALRALPERDQDLVILHELEEYTLKEAAALLEIPFETAKDRLRRARALLREHLQADLAVATASERRTTARLAKAAAPAVLVAVMAMVPNAAMAAPAGGGASGGAVSATGTKLVLAVVLAGGVAIGVVVDRLAKSPSPPGADRPAIVAAGGLARPVPLDAGAGSTADARPRSSADAQPAATIDAGARPAVDDLRARPDVDAEPQLIERARRTLRGGGAAAALRVLMAHERRFPAGQLAEERDILLVEAYLAIGDTRLAGERLRRYRASYPAGLHRQRADAAERQLAGPSP